MKIRFGIVGCGFLGNIIANAWKDGFLEDYELVGVTSRTQESRDKTAAETGCRSGPAAQKICDPGIFGGMSAARRRVRDSGNT